GVERDRERKAPLERLLLAVLDARVETREEHLDGPVAHAGALEHVAQANAAPAARADGLVEPRLADRARLEPGSAVPRALHRRDDLVRRQRAQLLEPERQLAVDEPVD